MQEDKEETEWFQYNYDAIGMEKANSYPTFHFYCAEQCIMSTAKERLTKRRAKIKADPKLYQVQR